MYADRVLSGMRPTGALHLGHYHGVLKKLGEVATRIRVFILRCRLACTDHPLRFARNHRRQRLGHGDRLAGCRR